MNTLDVSVEPQATVGVSKEIDYLHGGQFDNEVTIDVDLGTTNGLEMNITNALPNTQILSQGVNTFTITPSATSSVINILPTDNSQTHNFTINSITIEKVSSSVWVTKDDITQVVDYYPYGKVLREYVLGDKERYLTTQHERDQVTGLDYRGARYYDSDVARFLSLDPLASEFPGWSAYNYVMGNPVMLIDPDGRAPQTGGPGDGNAKLILGNSAEPSGKRIIRDKDDNLHFVRKGDMYTNGQEGNIYSYQGRKSGWVLYERVTIIEEYFVISPSDRPNITHNEHVNEDITENNNEDHRMANKGSDPQQTMYSTKKNYCKGCDDQMGLGDRLRRTNGWEEYKWNESKYRKDTFFYDKKSDKTYRWPVERGDTSTGEMYEYPISPRKWLTKYPWLEK